MPAAMTDTPPMLLGAARQLAEPRPTSPARSRFIFQPAEEGRRGRRAKWSMTG
jgi:metal-dependent amidase/aminoacylase/carboxypeptidase family protein